MNTMERRHLRVPLFTRVEIENHRGRFDGVSMNVSAAGMGVRYVGNEPAVDEEVTARFHAHQHSIAVRARIAWKTSEALGLSFIFDPHSETPELLAQFVKNFRCRVAIIDIAYTSFIKVALVNYLIDFVNYPERPLESDVGLIVLGDLRHLDAVLDTGLPIIYSASACPDEIARRDDGRVLYVPLDAAALRTATSSCLETYLLSLENARLTLELEASLEKVPQDNSVPLDPSPVDGMVGTSPAMQHVYGMIKRVAPLDARVLILGETGTGKDLAARALHRLSARAEKPFVAQSCALVAETLLDSELFGHARGAFTNAVVDHAGLFESADGGTVFLDEVAEMSPSMQVKLLHVLQRGEIRRVGESRVRSVNVRVICATHRDLQSLVKAGKFRADLYYRLGAVTVLMPPLRERRTDIPVLVKHFLQQSAPPARMADAALHVLEAHPWNGNVRELQYTIERLTILAQPEGVISAALVRENLPETSEASSLQAASRTFERERIDQALFANHGNITAAAKALGINRSTLSKRHKRLKET